MPPYLMETSFREVTAAAKPLAPSTTVSSLKSVGLPGSFKLPPDPAGSVETGAAPDYYKRAEICRQRMAPVLQRITANYPPVLLRPITSITAYKGQVIYDTPETQEKSQTPVSQLQWLPVPGVTPPPAPADVDLTNLLLPPSAPAPPSAQPVVPVDPAGGG